MQYLLESREYTVLGAENGWLGLQMALYNVPDIILLDIQLPGMDGYEVLHEIRSNPDIADIPVVAVTSYAMAGNKKQVLDAGATGYIEKPIDPETFADQVTSYLKA
jgi:CheY-like chemotaxis protein